MLTKRQITSLVEAGREFVHDDDFAGILWGDFNAFLNWAYTHATEYDTEHEGEPSDLDSDMIIGLFMGGALGERDRLLLDGKR